MSDIEALYTEGRMDLHGSARYPSPPFNSLSFLSRSLSQLKASLFYLGDEADLIDTRSMLDDGTLVVGGLEDKARWNTEVFGEKLGSLLSQISGLQSILPDSDSASLVL